MAVFFILALDFASALPARAETDCKLSQSDFDKLGSIQNDSSLSYVNAIKLELQLRKVILKNVMSCAISEATTLKTSIDKKTLSDRDALNLQSQLSNQMDNAVNYYKTQESHVDDLGLQGSKDFSKNLESWRNGNYKQPALMAKNFLIWSENQALFETAQSRVDQIGQSVNFLRLVYNQDIQNLWNDAEAQFTEAKNLNQESRSDLTSVSPNEALTTIKSSLDFLAKTYKKLSLLVNAIHQSLSLP